MRSELISPVPFLLGGRCLKGSVCHFSHSFSQGSPGAELRGGMNPLGLDIPWVHWNLPRRPPSAFLSFLFFAISHTAPALAVFSGPPPAALCHTGVQGHCWGLSTWKTGYSSFHTSDLTELFRTVWSEESFLKDMSVLRSPSVLSKLPPSFLTWGVFYVIFGCAGSSLWHTGFSSYVGLVAPWHSRSQFPDQGSNPYPLHWKVGS